MKKILNITLAVICLTMIFNFSALSASANSAQSFFSGVDSTGAIMPDGESPIIVENEVLTFDIPEFPSPGSFTEEQYADYSAHVTAQYTFYNPSEYTVTSRLLFPFGIAPSYFRLDYDDTQKYDITVNGEAIKKRLRHTLYDDYRQFELEQDLSLMHDGFVDHDFYKQDLTVTEYTYHVSGIDFGDNYSVKIAFNIPDESADRRVYLPNQSGFISHDNGDVTLLSYPQRNNSALVLYVFGEPFSDMPELKTYKSGDLTEKNELPHNIGLVNKKTLTFKEFAMSYREEGSSVSESDWYNAVVADLTSDKNSSEYPVAYADRLRYGLERYLLRWYEYEITLAPGERMVNSVTAPMYPAIDLAYEPEIFEYTYLLSPAKTWTSFGAIEIIINTPYHLTESGLGDLVKSENGYKLELDGLPDGELTFTLSTSETPQKTSSGLGSFDMLGMVFYGAGALAPYLIALFVIFILIIATIITVTVAIKIKKKNKMNEK